MLALVYARRLAVALALLASGCDVDPGGEDAGGPDAGLPAAPPTLSAAGLYADGVIGGALAEGVRAYSVRNPLWTDGLEKHRYLVLPEGASIDTSDPDHWAFPEGTRLFKEFVSDGRLLETRLLWKAGPSSDDWVYVAYRAREDGSDGDPVPDGEADVLGTDHDIPSTQDCAFCHRGGRDFVLGPGAFQLAREDFDAWVAAGMLPPDTVYADPPGDDTARAALGYLHGNCGHCHDDVHPIASFRTLRLRLTVGTTSAAEAPAWVTSAGIDANHELDGTRVIIQPGDPASSQLYVRMAHRDELAMPPLGTDHVDDAGLAAIGAWITSGP